MYLNSVSEEESWDHAFACDVIVLGLNLCTRSTAS